jgi:hypothetical protein
MRVSLSPQDFKELLLSHHPYRPCFDDDVIVLFGRSSEGKPAKIYPDCNYYSDFLNIISLTPQLN